MGGACCKPDVEELNPDGSPKEPQTKEQKKNDAPELRTATKAADWAQMKMLLRRMPAAQINSGATKAEGDPDEAGNTALHFSVSINHLKGVKKLVRYAHRVGPKNAAGKTPLHFALETGKQRVASFLLEHKDIEVNEIDVDGASAFLNVVASGRKKLALWTLAECSRLQLELGLDTVDKKGRSVILYCAQYGWFDLLEDWVDRLKTPSAVLNVQSCDGETTLGWLLKFAASGLMREEDATRLTKKLLDAGAIAKLPSFEEKVPPIHLAAASNFMAVYDAVKAAGGDPLTAVDSLGRTALHFAAARGATETAAALLDLGLKPYQTDKQRNTPLHLAAMRGQESTVKLLLSKADNEKLALTTTNRDGLSVYHLALKAQGEHAQKAALDIIERLGEDSRTPIFVKKGVVKETPLLLAIGAHQDLVVKKLLDMGTDVNEATFKGELPLSRNLASVTAETYDADANIFDMLINAGSAVDTASADDHPLLAICKNNMSNFAERAVETMSKKGGLDWDRKDSKGYTPLLLSSFHNNVWLVRYLIDEAKLAPNDPSQRTKQGAPVVVGSTGSMCCKKQITTPGTVGNQTALMCAAKGASLGALKMLIARGAKVNDVDSEGRTALAYALMLDKPETLECAKVLLAAGAKPYLVHDDKKVPMLDITGESWLHRAVRYGDSSFVKEWARFAGALAVLATTPEDADDMPGAELKAEEKQGFLDAVPTMVELEEEEGADELVQGEDDGGQDSEDEEAQKKKGDGEGKEGGKAIGEGAEDGMAEEEEDVVASLVAAGEVVSHYAGPTATDLRRWRKSGTRWWQDFWVDAEEDVPPEELEDLGWQDKYNFCDVGEDDVDEEDVLEVLRDQDARAAAGALPRGGALKAIRTARPGVADATHAKEPGSPSRSLGDLANRLLGRSRQSSMSADSSPTHRAGPVAEGASSFSLAPSSSSSKQLANLRVNSGGSSRGGAAGGFEAAGVYSPVRRSALAHGSGVSGGGADAALEAAQDAQEQIDRLAYQAALDFGLTEEVMLAYGIPPPPSRTAAKPGPVAEGMEMQNAAKSIKGAASFIGVEKSATSAMSIVAGTPGEKLWAAEPFYQPATRYKGLPKYMDEEVHNWWPKVDCSGAKVAKTYDAEVQKKMKKLGEPKPQEEYFKEGGLWDIEKRLKEYEEKQGRKKAAAMLVGADLRERNINWYLRSMSPQEFPMKAGQWKSFLNKSKKALTAARTRAPCKPGEKPQPRKKKVWFGLPDLPTRPELQQTSPMVLAVRLGRVDCVKELLGLQHPYKACEPDAFGLTPLSYALLLLLKDRHNTEVKRMVDLLLASRPLVSSRLVASMFLSKRAEGELKEFQAKVDKNGGAKAPKAMRKELEQMQVLVDDLKNFKAEDRPTLMDPLVLATLMNDMPRVAWMVLKCGGNLNDSWIPINEVPIYVQGFSSWEKVVGRTQSRVLPLHVAILNKKFESVRLLLDMGADPNAVGMEFTGNPKKDLRNRNKLLKEKMDQVAENAADAAASNPYERMWKVPTTGLLAMFGKIKRFICSIEIPGITRPHPWLSPLHLSCRLGQAPITFLLLKRGAAANGAGAAAFAPKSPLEEALSYARNNAQSYNVLCDRQNYQDVRDKAHLDDSDLAMLAAQTTKMLSITTQLMAKCEAIAQAKASKDKGNAPSAQDIYDKAMKAQMFMPSTLAMFGVNDLAGIAIPDMNIACKSQAAMNMVSDIGDWMDPTKGPIKAACLAAKIIIKVYLNMMKRPIAHFDPALYTAHVMMWHRAPLKVEEKQTSIVLRDMIDNGTYAWLNLDPEVIADHVWKQSAVNKINVIKTNDEIGYKFLDMTPKPKEYEKARRKFEDRVESAFYNIATEAILPAYNLPTLVQHLNEAAAAAGQAAKATIKNLRDLKGSVSSMLTKTFNAEVSSYMGKCLKVAQLPPDVKADPEVKRDRIAAIFGTQPLPSGDQLAWGEQQAAKLQEGIAAKEKDLVKSAGKAALEKDETTPRKWVKSKAQGAALAGMQAEWLATVQKKVPTEFSDAALELAKSKLPLWYVQLADKQSKLTVESITDKIATAFSGFDIAKQKAKVFEGLPQNSDSGSSRNPLELMLASGADDLSYKMPDFPVNAMAGLARDLEQLSVPDTVKAVYSCFVQATGEKVQVENKQRAAMLGGIMDECTKLTKKEATTIADRMTKLLQDTKAKVEDGSLLELDANAIVSADVDSLQFKIAGAKLGPNGPAVVAALQKGLGQAAGPDVTAALVKVAKGLGAQGLADGCGALLSGLEAAIPELQFDTGFAAHLGRVAKGEVVVAAKAAAVAAGAGAAAAAAAAATKAVVSLSPKEMQSKLTGFLSDPAKSQQFIEGILGDDDLQAELQARGADALFDAVQRRTGVAVGPGLRERLAAMAANPDEILNMDDALGMKVTEAQAMLGQLLQGNEFRDQLVQGILQEGQGLEGAMEGKGVNALCDAFQKKTGVRIDPEERKGLQAAAGEAVDGVLDGDVGEVEDAAAEAENVVEDVAEKAVEDAVDAAEGYMGNAVTAVCMKSRVGRAVAGVLKANPEVAKALKEQAEEAAKDLEEQVNELSDPSAALDSLLGEGVSLDSLGGTLMDMQEGVMEAFEAAGGDVADQMVLGLQLDMAADFEAVVQAFSDARDALVSILDILGMDVV